MKPTRKWIKDPKAEENEWTLAFLRSDEWILFKHDSGLSKKAARLTGIPVQCWVLRNTKQFSLWAEFEQQLHFCDYLPQSIKTQRQAIAYANVVIGEWEQAQANRLEALAKLESYPSA